MQPSSRRLQLINQLCGWVLLPVGVRGARARVLPRRPFTSRKKEGRKAGGGEGEGKSLAIILICGSRGVVPHEVDVSRGLELSSFLTFFFLSSAIQR